MIKIAIFDLDMTLSESRQNISEGMANLLSRLLVKHEVAIISGGSIDRLMHQAVSLLPDKAEISRLTLLPQSGTSCYQYVSKAWERVYEHNLSVEEKKRIYKAIENVSDIEKPAISEEPRTEDKGGEITYSPVGIEMDPKIKSAYDPDGQKRKKIVSKLNELLPDFEIGIGGSSSIDITKKGMDKSFGIIKILEIKRLTVAEAVYIGDRLSEGGNDYPVVKSGIKCISVKGPRETERVIEDILSEGI